MDALQNIQAFSGEGGWRWNDDDDDDDDDGGGGDDDDDGDNVVSDDDSMAAWCIGQWGHKLS